MRNATASGAGIAQHQLSAQPCIAARHRAKHTCFPPGSDITTRNLAMHLRKPFWQPPLLPALLLIILEVSFGPYLAQPLLPQVLRPALPWTRVCPTALAPWPPGVQHNDPMSRAGRCRRALRLCPPGAHLPMRLTAMHRPAAPLLHPAPQSPPLPCLRCRCVDTAVMRPAGTCQTCHAGCSDRGGRTQWRAPYGATGQQSAEQ